MYLVKSIVYLNFVTGFLSIKCEVFKKIEIGESLLVILNRKSKNCFFQHALSNMFFIGNFVYFDFFFLSVVFEV